MQKRLTSDIWFGIGVAALALTWLLPNHSPPWMAFHSEAWSALVLSIVAMGVLLRGRQESPVSIVAVLIGLLSLGPLLQYAFGHIEYRGTAWICFIYLAGLAIAIQIGAHWAFNVADEAADFIFLSVTSATAVSVLLQIYQLLQCEFAGVWVMHVQNGTRFFANLAQPNQLGTLQVLGVLGVGWMHYKRFVSGRVALGMSALVLLGLALTGSRTAYLNIFFTAVTLHLAYREPQFRLVRRAIWFLVGYFVLCVLAVPIIEQYIYVGELSQSLRIAQAADDPRWEIWKMFFAASLIRPWVGYGWGQVTSANFAVAEQFPSGLGLFNGAHNLLLDGIIWVGYPLALLVFALALRWIWRLLKSSLDISAIYRIGFMQVMLVHAALELPLHYAYFLLPFGVIVGTLDVRIPIDRSWSARRWVLLPILLMSIGAVVLIVRDYLRIESASYALRFEAQGIQLRRPFEVPQVLILDQFSDYFALARAEPAEGVNASQLQVMRNSVNATPSARTVYNLAASLALNGEAVEARHWLLVLCKTMAVANCAEAKERWTLGNYPERTGVQWPSTPGTDH